MKPASWDKQLGLASPLECAASQGGKIKSPSNKETRLDASYTPMSPARGEEKTFFLDILFNRMSETRMFRQATISEAWVIW
jgi:hypothetical protein